MANAASHLRAVPTEPQPEPTPDERPALTAAVYEVLDVALPLDELAADGHADALNGDELIELRDRLAEIASVVASAQAAVDTAANGWVWKHGYVPDGRHKSKVCQMGGQWWKAALTGSSSSLKKADKLAIWRRASEVLAARLVDMSGGTPGDSIDTQVRLILSVACEELGRAFTPDPQAKVLGAGLGGEPVDGVPWGIRTSDFYTPSTGARRKTIVRYDPESKGDEDGS
jgi:hypothetical protein